MWLNDRTGSSFNQRIVSSINVNVSLGKTLLSLRSPCDFTSHMVHWTWLVWWHDPADAPPTPPLPPSAWWITEVWIVVHAYYQLFIHCHIHWMGCYSVMLPSVHMASIASVHPGRRILLCCSPEGFFPFFPRESFFSISWEFFLIRCEVLGQGCHMCKDCKALWGKFVFCDNGLKKMNWIDLN